MKTLNLYKRIVFLIAGVIVLCGCAADLTYEEPNNNPPVVQSVSPSNAPKYSEITLRGENLNKVAKVYIGDEEVEVKSKITNTEMTIIASGTQSGAIKVTANINNKNIVVTSDRVFTYNFVSPEISSAPENVEAGTTVILKGSNLLAAEEIYIADADNVSSMTRATIIQRLENEILIGVPYAEYASVKFVATYYDGNSVVASEPADLPPSQLIVIAPEVTGFAPSEVDENGTITITGTDLNKVSAVKIGGTEVSVISKTATQLIVKIQTDAFPDGTSSGMDLVLEYFDGDASKTVGSNITVNVSQIIIGKNQTVGGRGRDVNFFRCFYSLQLGQAMDNASFATLVDPVAATHLAGGTSDWVGTPMTAANNINKSVITKEEYNSVAPYIYVQTTSGGNVQLNGPGHSVGVFRNLHTIASGGTNILGGLSVNACGTPLVMSLQLLPRLTDANFTAAEAAINAIVDQVRAGSLTVIDAAGFPIDVANHTIAGIPLKLSTNASALTGGPNYTAFTRGIVAQTNTSYPDLPTSEQDGVLMVIYYDYDFNYDPANPAKGISRIGFVHVTGIDFGTINNTEYQRVKITLNSYFQKRANNPVQ